MKEILSRLIWYPKQLLPLQYVSQYGQDGKKFVTVWRMWFGRSFHIKTWEYVNRF